MEPLLRSGGSDCAGVQVLIATSLPETLCVFAYALGNDLSTQLRGDRCPGYDGMSAAQPYDRAAACALASRQFWAFTVCARDALIANLR